MAVDGLDIVIGTSPQLMQHSHGKSRAHLAKFVIQLTCLQAWITFA